MGPLGLEFLDEVVEIVSGRLGCLKFQCQMHALMAAVLLRVARLDALDADAEPEPPHRQPRQIEQSVWAGEGYAIVGPDRPGQTELLEGALEHGEAVDFLGRVKGFAGQEIATGEIGDRQRVAIAFVGERELTPCNRRTRDRWPGRDWKASFLQPCCAAACGA